MAFNGSGVFNRLYNWVVDAAAGVNILAVRMDAEMDGFATGLSTCVTKDGQTVPTANLPMGGFKHTNIANGSTRAEYPSIGQIQDGTLHVGTDSGAANAYVIGLTPAITAYATNMRILFKATNANTGASTVAVNGLAAKAIITSHGAVLVGGQIRADQYIELIYDGTSFRLIDSFANGLIGGQCILGKSGANLVLNRFNGKYLTIAGVNYEVPSAGVTLAPTSLAASTFYYIYAYMNAGTMTLEASTTSRATDATTGMQIKNGDSTRTLVGIGRTDGAVAWEANQRSWFNDPGYTAVTTFSVDRSTTSVTTTEINSEIRNGFLSWTGEPVLATANGSNSVNVATNTIRTQIAFNTSAQTGIANDYRVDTNVRDFSIQANNSTLTEGYNYATIYGYVTANQGTWASSGTALRVHIGPRR